MYELFGQIFWLKFALIEATNFIGRRFGLMTFFKTVCFHTGQDKNLRTTKNEGLVKTEGVISSPIYIKDYLHKRKGKNKGKNLILTNAHLTAISSSIFLTSAPENDLT